MTESNFDIKEFLQQKLKQGNLDLVDAIALPRHGDRLVRLRTLQEMWEDFESRDSSDDSVSYIIQVKPMGAALGQGVPVGQAGQANSTISSAGQERDTKPQLDGIYFPNGKLNTPYLMQNAELLFSSGDYRLARKIYKTILQSGENSASALFGIARTLEAEGNYVEAKRNYEESIAYHPTLESYRRLASVLILLKSDVPAAEILERALNLREISPAIRLELHKLCAQCLGRARKLVEAERHYQRALAINPAADEIRTGLGTLYLQAGKTAEAKKHFLDAVVSNPKNDKALIGVASCFLGESDKRMAHDYFAAGLEIQINNPNAVFHLVKCAYELKSYATAARLLEAYIEVAPINTNLLYSLAGLQYHLGRMDDARRTTHKILQMQAQHVGALDLIKLIDRFSEASQAVALN